MRQIYLANPAQSRPLAQYYAGIEALRGLMRLEDLRRFDLVAIAAKGDNQNKEYLTLERSRQKQPQLISPELWHQHFCWAWSLQPGAVVWSDDALQKLVKVSSDLDDRYGSATDIPLVGSDIKDKTARLSQGVATLVHSTQDHHTVSVLPEHIEYVGQLIRKIYDHDNCRLDEYSSSCQSETKLTEEEYTIIKNELENLKNQSIDKQGVDDLLSAFRRNDCLSLDDLTGLLDLSRASVRMRVAILRKHSLLRSGRQGYRRTSRFVAFLRRLDKDGKQL